VDRGYRALLAWALDHGKTVIAVSVALFLGSLGMVALTGFEFLPKYDRAQFEIRAELPPSVHLEAAEARAVEIEEIVRDIPEVTHIYTVVGGDTGLDHVVMRVLTQKKGERDRDLDAIQDEVRERLGVLAGVDVSVIDAPLVEGAGMQRPIEVELRGASTAALEEAADLVRVELSRIRGAAEIQTTYRPGKPELRVEVDRDKAAAAGLSVGQAGIALRMAVTGQVVGTFREGEHTADIRVLAREEDRTPEGLMRDLPKRRLVVDLSQVESIMSLGVAVLEQPLAAERDAALSHLERAVPVCADESFHDRASFDRVRDAYDMVNIKLDKAGGLTEALACANEAGRLGLSVMVGCMVSTSLAIEPALLMAERAAYVDLDGPLLLEADRPGAQHDRGSGLLRPSPGVWGGT